MILLYFSVLFSPHPPRNNNFQYKELTNEFDLNNALGKYRTDSSAIITSLKNKPSEIRNSGEVTIDWYPANERNTYGIQIMRWTFGTTHMIFTRNKTENTWAEWVQCVTKSDFKVLKKKDVQFSDGFAEISFPGLTYDSAVCINQEYKSSAGVQNLVFTAQVKPNELIIYARNAHDGSSYNGIIHIMAIAIG